MTAALEIEVLPDAETLASAAALRVAAALAEAISATGRATLALSGGRTPPAMHAALSTLDIEWDCVHALQVDERQVDRDDPDRNLTGLREALLDRVPIPYDHVHVMPVDDSDLDRAALDYERVLRDVAPDGIDVVHLGLGTDGHTASLVPGDPVLDVDDRLVAPTRRYKGHRRLTLTYPALRAARNVVWVVSGAAKATAVRRLVAGAAALPARRGARARAGLICGRAAWLPV